MPAPEHAEADTFFCFTNLMSENRDNFIKSLDDSQCGITSRMESVYALLRDKDLELYLKLVRACCWELEGGGGSPPQVELLLRPADLVSPQEEQSIKPQYFTFRWLTLLLSQEFLLPDVIRIWDTLFSDRERFHFLILVCCAMLM